MLHRSRLARTPPKTVQGEILVYETWFITCQDKDEKDAEMKARGDAKMARKLKDAINSIIILVRTTGACMRMICQH